MNEREKYHAKVSQFISETPDRFRICDIPVVYALEHADLAGRRDAAAVRLAQVLKQCVEILAVALDGQI